VILAGRIQAMVQDHGDPVVTPKWGGLDGLKMLGMMVFDFFSWGVEPLLDFIDLILMG
jgi:hypothetical protein